MTRREPDPIHDLLVARVDDWLENALAPQDCAAALQRVLEIARAAESAALRWEDQLPVPYWVEQVRSGIAEALNVRAEAGAA